MISLLTHRLRHHLYGMIGLAAAHSIEGLLSGPETPAGPGPPLLRQLVDGPLSPDMLRVCRLRHLKMIAVQMIPPLLRRTPPGAVGQVVTAVVAPILDCMCRRIV